MVLGSGFVGCGLYIKRSGFFLFWVCFLSLIFGE